MVLLLLQLLVLADGLATGAPVSSSAGLLAALQSTAEEVVLLNDVAMGPEFEPFERAPLVIKRCVVAVVSDACAACVCGGVIRLISPLAVL